MKEVLTRSFWQGVKRTFYAALEALLPGDSASQTTGESKTKDSPAAENPSIPSVTNE
jgi:hypothetical protein